MALTLNIVSHELEKLGQVTRMLEDNPAFEGVRFFLEGKSPNPSFLYVCDERENVQALHVAGCHAVFIGPESSHPDKNAAISLASPQSAPIVFDTLLDVQSRYDAWERSMDRVIHTGGTLQDLVDASEPFLVNHVVVLDPALKLLAYTKNVPCDDPITVELIKHGYHTEDNIRKFKLNRRFKPWSECDGFVINDTRAICKYTTVAKSFKARTAFSLISVMMCNVVDADAHLLDVFDLFAKRVEFFALRDYPDNKPSGSVVDTFLKDLIAGEISDESTVVERCRYAGIPPKAQFCLFFLKADEYSVPSSRLVADVSLSVAPAKTLLVDDAVVVLCFNCQNSSCARHCVANACPLNKRTISQRLNELLDRYDLTCGRRSKFTELALVPIAYQQAKHAYEMSRDRNVAANASIGRVWNRIFSFDAYAVTHLAKRLSDTDKAMFGLTYANSILAELAEQDLISKTNNYEFLYTYLVHERRLTAVADKLHMHRNNVSYRIGRIEEQYGIDTSDPQLRQDMLLAYAIRNALVQNAQ